MLNRRGADPNRLRPAEHRSGKGTLALNLEVMTMALHFPPEWLDENLPEDFDPSDLSPYRALDRHADYVAEQLENPPLIMIDLEGDSVEKIRQKLQTPRDSPPGCGCGNNG
jgi:hypothetical protein